MKTREIRHLGYNKIADAADFNRSTDFEHICSMFRWEISPEGSIFWSLVDGRNFTEALKICPQYREESKEVINYKQVLLDAYASQDLTPEDFANTLEHFEELIKSENK